MSNLARGTHLFRDRKTERRIIRWITIMAILFAVYVLGSVALANGEPRRPSPPAPELPPAPVVIVRGGIVSVIPMSGGDWSTPGSGNNRPGWSW